MSRAKDDQKVSLLYVICGSLAEAEEVGRKVVEDRLAACANIIDGMRSVYRWEGQVESGREVVLLLKTRSARAGDLGARVRDLHSYEVPCVIELPIESGSEDYLDWIVRETSG